jgi:hypothetical protein
MANAGWFRGPYLWQLGVPVLHVLLVCERRGEKWNVLGARDPARRYCGHAVEPRFAGTMIAIDQAVAPGGDFRQQDRAHKIRRAYGLFVQTRTAIVRNVWNGGQGWDLIGRQSANFAGGFARPILCRFLVASVALAGCIPRCRRQLPYLLLDLMQEWDEPEADFAAAVSIVPEQVIDFVREQVVAKVPVNEDLFTKRELRMMHDLAMRFRDEMTRPLINFTHAERGPWDKIWDNGRGNNERIPFTLSIEESDPHREAILESARDYHAIAAAEDTTRMQ